MSSTPPARKDGIAVIGGSGFIGSVLTGLLAARNPNVVIVDIAKPAEGHVGVYRAADVCNLGQLTAALEGCNQIINLAAVHRDDVRPLSRYREVNVSGAANVCRAAEAQGINDITFTSSVAVYGFQEGETDESAPTEPFNEYGRTKLQAEQIYRAWQSHAPAKRRLVMVRPTVVFGPGNRGNVYNLIAQLARQHFVMIGKGENRKSMAYVGNVAAFLARQMLDTNHAPGVSLFNYADSPDYDMNGLLGTVRNILGRDPNPSVRLPYAVGIAIGTLFDFAAKISGRNFPVSRVRIQKFCSDSVFSPARARRTGFQPPFALEDALQQTIRHDFSSSRT